MNFLLSKENWDNVFKEHTANSAYNEFVTSFGYYHEIAIPEMRVRVKEKKNKWVTKGIRESSKRLRWLNKAIKNGNLTEELKYYYKQYKTIYTKSEKSDKKDA